MSKRVLVIEDEPHIAEAIGFILSRDGWKVRRHSDGATALEAIRAEPVDVLILDVMLPGRSGYEILEALRADAATRDLPILLLTARGQARDVALAERLGADRIITKPFSNADLLDTLRAMAGG